MESYLKIRKIGEGAFGKALLVKRKQDGKQCVIKEINISRMSSKEREESKKEVKVLSQLKHPNIVSYLESFQGEGNLYIVMDYCERGDLYKFIVNQKGIYLAETQVLDIFVQCCLAIKHIHDRKILHRDIKTQNIFLTKHLMVKLGDFGIARVLKSTMELARTCIGTPYYLSPEIVENRPYNNKSDVWSLGCVLYELATLKHAFEAGNMKNLVLKIVRGSYPPVSSRYSYELRALIAQCFKRSPSDRPSINTILKKPIIQKRITKFLSPEEVNSEFSHTVLHKDKLNIINPAPARAPAVLKKQIPAKRVAGPAAVYGASVAKKPGPVRRPGSNQGAINVKKNSDQSARSSAERRQEIDARQRRRKEIVSQEQQYHDYMKKIQKQRWEKQQATQIGRARELGWKNVLGSDEIKEKKKDPMKKYQPYENEEKVEKNHKNYKQLPDERPVVNAVDARPVVKAIDARPVVKAIDAWGVANEAKANGLKRADAAEKARVLDDFWQRKKEAAVYKARGHNEMYGNARKEDENPLLRFHNEQMEKHAKRAEKPPMHPAGRNKHEMEYLKQLEAIRRQNYIERKAMQVNNAPGQLYQAKQENNIGGGDPKYDSEARQKKIENLKKQAEERSEILKKQLESRKKQVAERLEKERQERVRRNKEIKKPNSRPLPKLEDRIIKVNKIAKADIITPAVGMDTAMNQVARPKLFRSCSEGDLQELMKPSEKGKRKNWGGVAPSPLALANMPLEITSSAMEATTAAAKVNAWGPNRQENPLRKQWGPEGKTQLVSKLHNVDLSGTVMPTMTIKAEEERITERTNKNTIGKTIVLSSKTENKSPSNNSPNGIGGTIVISTTAENDAIKTDECEIKSGSISFQTPVTIPIGETIVIQPGKSTLESHIDISPSKKNLEISKTIVISPKKKTDLKLDDVDTPTDDVESNNTGNDEQPNGEGSVLTVSSESNHINEKINQNEEQKPAINTKPKQAWTSDSTESLGMIKETPKNENLLLSPEDEDESFHTPSRSFGLQTGCYDTEKKLLRTCSLPDLRQNLADSRSFNQDDRNNGNISSSKDSDVADEKLTLKCDDDVGIEDIDDINDLEAQEEEEENLVNEDDGNNDEEDKNDDEEGEEENSDDEEFEEYESMIQSMRNVLSNTAHSPQSTSTKSGVKREEDYKGLPSDNEGYKDREEDDPEDDEQWDNENDEGEEDIENKTKNRKDHEAKLQETLFSRIEESRKALEDELGLDLFVKVYRHVQMIQDNEDDGLELAPSEASDLLGEKDYLYQKILYLVMADSAYCEGNDGLS